MFPQHAVAFLILLKLKLVMVWGGGGVIETWPELLQLYGLKWIFDSGSSNPSAVLRPPRPHLSTRRFNHLPLIHNFSVWMPLTWYHPPSPSILQICRHCHSKLMSRSDVRSSALDKLWGDSIWQQKILPLVFLEATAELRAMWSSVREWRRVRGAECGTEGVSSVQRVVGELQRNAC